MSSREEILKAVKENTHANNPMPNLAMENPIIFDNKVERFIEINKIVGGTTHVLQEGESIDDVIKKNFPDAKRIGSNLPFVKCATFNPDDLAKSQELDGTDLGIVQGKVGVAENAAIWIPQEIKHKALFFISEGLVILLEKKNLLNNMHEAYKWLDDKKYEFGVFMSGPSKTADIEQALVFGAHGPRQVLVILM